MTASKIIMKKSNMEVFAADLLRKMGGFKF